MLVLRPFCLGIFVFATSTELRIQSPTGSVGVASLLEAIYEVTREIIMALIRVGCFRRGFK